MYAPIAFCLVYLQLLLHNLDLPLWLLSYSENRAQPHIVQLLLRLESHPGGGGETPLAFVVSGLMQPQNFTGLYQSVVLQHPVSCGADVGCFSSWEACQTGS